QAAEDLEGDGELLRVDAAAFALALLVVSGHIKL
ncbi:MAG: hypothetical protein QOH44_2390, partial [Actinomycetota bacterium]|nr:hypothetical protein [Actinomycetota bacterium]